ncbi:MAG: MAE_28990/MAE_18760 family HEPN-like nuclease, partial [Bacteroidales bacterium]|nr:MAE_28990/MAE_18760 family HEPN-like nuclease [Bacteroidales bacterium]
QYLKEKFQTINDTIKKAKKSGEKDARLASMLSSYLVVWISGVYEDMVEHLFAERVKKVNDKEIENFVEVFIGEQFRSPRYENIKKLVKAFDPKYGYELRSKIEDKNITALDSIVNNKNKAAHGEVSNATIDDIIGWNKDTIKIFEELENILKVGDE